MIPIVIEWAPAESNYIAATQSFVQNVPLTLKYAVPYKNNGINGQTYFSGQPAYQNNLSLIFNNAATGVPDITQSTHSYCVELPPGQSRSVTVTCSVNGASVTIVGTDQYGGTITAPPLTTVANNPVSTGVYFTKIYSVTCTNSSTGTMSVGIGNSGYTSFPMLDIYNKNSLYTISYTNVSAFTSLTPVFTTDPLIKFIDRVQTITKFSIANTFALNITNQNIVSINTSGGPDVSETPIDLNLNQTASFSFSGIPLTSLGSQVINAASPFTQTIIQQGGRF